jgi:hypothetical protein
LWKIRWLTTSIRPPNFHVNDFWDTKATIANLRASAAENALPRLFMIPRWQHDASKPGAAVPVFAANALGTKGS